jgi:hypothetical protein
VLALELGVRSVDEALGVLRKLPLPAGVSMDTAGFGFRGVEFRLIE